MNGSRTVTSPATRGWLKSGWFKSGLRREESVVGLVFVLPSVALFLVFGLYPFVRTVMLSFSEWNGISPEIKWVGLANYVSIFNDPIWWLSVVNGLFFAVTALVFMNGLALVLAVVVNQLRRGQQIYQLIYYLPSILSGIVVAIIWKWLYQPLGGPLNQMLAFLGGQPQAWLADSRTAAWAVAVASMWAGIGNPFLLFLAGLQGIPKDVIEAARIDGASEVRVFQHIILPLLIPVIVLVSVLTFLGAMQIFNLIVAMTNGGPGYTTEVPVLRIYREAFRSLHFGYAAALSIVFGVMLLLMSALQFKLSRMFDNR